MVKQPFRWYFHGWKQSAPPVMLKVIVEEGGELTLVFWMILSVPKSLIFYNEVSRALFKETFRLIVLKKFRSNYLPSFGTCILQSQKKEIWGLKMKHTI